MLRYEWFISVGEPRVSQKYFGTKVLPRYFAACVRGGHCILSGPPAFLTDTEPLN